MSFIPGDLHLVREGNGEHVLTLGSSEIMRTRSEKKAIARFEGASNPEMEVKYPARELTPEERAAMFELLSLKR